MMVSRGARMLIALAVLAGCNTQVTPRDGAGGAGGGRNDDDVRGPAPDTGGGGAGGGGAGGGAAGGGSGAPDTGADTGGGGGQSGADVGSGPLDMAPPVTTGFVRFKVDGMDVMFGERLSDARYLKSSKAIQVRSNSNTRGLSIVINVMGPADATCAVATPNGSIQYTPTVMPLLSYNAGLGNGSCTLKVTTFGAVGERVQGEFSGTLNRQSGEGAASITITEGAFDLPRTNDV